ncbi:hypothetical protein Holit_01818 [Hollandina sp. SP2]
MKKKLFLTGILSMALIFGLVLLGCPTNDDDGGGNSNSGGGNLIIKVSGLTNGTTYYVGPVWNTDSGLSASGYRAKSAAADANGVVTVEYTSDDITNVWGKDCYIGWDESDFIVNHTSTTAYKMEARTITVDSATGGDVGGGEGGDGVQLPANLRNTQWESGGGTAVYDLEFGTDKVTRTGGMGGAPERVYTVVSAVENGKILLKRSDGGDDRVLCESYTVAGATLTLTGSGDDFHTGSGTASSSGTYTKAGASGGGGDDETVPSDKRAELAGTWLLDNGSDQEKIEYEGQVGESNDPLYFIKGPAGVTQYYGQIVSYDGTIVVLLYNTENK